MTAAFIAAGIDPSQHAIFNQSRVSAHAELAWIFNCVARLGWLNRMTQFKEKAGKDRENASIGLYDYPGADGGRHPALSRRCRAGRRGPEAASRTDPRHRPEIQQRLFAGPHRGANRSGRLFQAARAADPGSGDARHEPARRIEEDVKVRCLRPVSHQPHRRRRHDRRPRSAAPRPTPMPCPPRWRASPHRPEADNLVAIFAGLVRAVRRRRCSGNTAAASSRPSRRR